MGGGKAVFSFFLHVIRWRQGGKATTRRDLDLEETIETRGKCEVMCGGSCEPVTRYLEGGVGEI